MGIDYFTKSWSRFMSWIMELGILWLFITRTGICIRINPRQRFRQGQLLSYYGGASLNMSINYHVPVVNTNLTHISLSFSTAVFMKARQISHWGMKLNRLFCWIVFQYLQSIKRFLHSHIFTLFPCVLLHWKLSQPCLMCIHLFFDDFACLSKISPEF